MDAKGEMSVHDLAICVKLTDACPKCGGDLDSRYECDSCGFDAMPLVVLADAPRGRH